MSTPENSAQAEALKKKELGNEKYKAKEFDAAIALYEEAFKLDPTNVSVLTNKAGMY